MSECRSTGMLARQRSHRARFTINSLADGKSRDATSQDSISFVSASMVVHVRTSPAAGFCSRISGRAITAAKVDRQHYC